MKKLLVLTIVAAVLAIPAVAQAGYSSGSCSGQLNVSFSSAVWVGGHGWSSGGRNCSCSISCSNCQFTGVYGWGTNPLVEYYHSRATGTNRGSYNCGGTATLYTKSCNGPNITGSGPFTQYNISGGNRDMGCHCNGWNSLGWGTNCGGGYQVCGAENYGGGSGSATMSASGGNWYTVWWGSGSVSHSCGGGGTTTTTSGYTTTTTSGGGGGNIPYRLRARSTDGQGRVNLRIDNNTIATFTLGTGMGDHNASSYNQGGINVEFFNDAEGRDVQIDYLSVDGDWRQAENQSYNTAVWQNGSCGGSYSEWMHCNGVLGFGQTPGGGGGGGTTTTTASSWWGGGWW